MTRPNLSLAPVDKSVNFLLRSWMISVDTETRCFRKSPNSDNENVLSKIPPTAAAVAYTIWRIS